MTKTLILAAVSALAIAAAPAPAPKPVASFTMDATTRTTFGQGASRDLVSALSARAAPANPEALHGVPAGLGVGPTLPLLGHRETVQAGGSYSPNDGGAMKGRILVYWGCGEHAGPGQPKITDFTAMMNNPEIKAAMARASRSGATTHTVDDRVARWPNARDGKTLRPNASLAGAHKVTSAYSPEMAFTLANDFMPDLGLRAGAAMPSGAVPLSWTPAAAATGYALSFAGSNGQGNDLVMWYSSTTNTPISSDFESPEAVKKRIAGGTALAPTVTRCVLPAEVAKAAPIGGLNLVGYGPWATFSDKPKLPTWTARARFKTESMTMLGMPDMGAMGMGGMMGGDQPAAPAPGQPTKKKKKFGLGDVLKSVAPIAIP